MLNESELKKLEQIANEAAGEDIDGCPDCRDIAKKFRNLFTPRTCAELVREVLRLRANEQGEQALDLITERRLKPEISEAIDEARKP